MLQNSLLLLAVALLHSSVKSVTAQKEYTSFEPGIALFYLSIFEWTDL